MKKNNIIIAVLLLFAGFLTVSALSIENQNTNSALKAEKAYKLVKGVVNKMGTYNDLLKKKDVVYTYEYITPDGKMDKSQEKYIFDGEMSYGAYHTHQRTFADLPGIIEQGYDGKEYWLKHKGKIIDDAKRMKRVKFNRPTNFYWFAMFQKLLDPGLQYEYKGEKAMDNANYDIVKVSFEDTSKPSDIYQLFINKETGLVDQFLFTVAEFGLTEVPKLMKVEYEKIDGMLIPSKRIYKTSNWEATPDDTPWIHVNWKDIKFNNNLTPNNFNKKMNTMANTEKDASLKQLLEEKKTGFAQRASEEKKRIYKEGIEAVEQAKVVANALQVGEKAPNFALTNALGEQVALYDYLEQGEVVLTWYRGGWCPYCNFTLHHLQKELPNFKAAGANLLALTPELPDNSISTKEKNNLEFEVLSDIGNKVAKEYGIVFQLTDEVAKIYNASFDMNGYNGDDSNELPLAATYIIKQDGTVVYAFLDADYRNRAEPSELTDILNGMHTQLN